MSKPTVGAPEGRRKGSRGPSSTETISGYPSAYEEALRIDQDASGTVCTDLSHYQNRTTAKGHFHEVPYRTGFVHNYRKADEHYHVNEKEAHQCPDDWMQKEKAGK